MNYLNSYDKKNNISNMNPVCVILVVDMDGNSLGELIRLLYYLPTIKMEKKAEGIIEQIVDETYLLIKSFDFKKIGEDLEYLPFCNIFMKGHDNRSKRRECKPKDLAVLLFILKKRREKINSLIEEIKDFLDSLII